MRAIRTIDPGPESRLVIEEVASPTPAADELLVRVRATALNRADLLQRQGKYPPPEGASEILGLEMAGEVVSWGDACSGWHAGDRVCGLLPGGGYAEYVVLPQVLAMRMPGEMSFEQAAGMPEVFLTAYQALFWLGAYAAGDSVLIHAGGSGVGTAAIQLAKHIQGNDGGQIFVTASKGKHETCLSLGADTAIDYKTQDFAGVVQEVTKGAGVDVVLDFIGAPYFEQNLAALGMDGRLVLLAMMGGSWLDGLSLGKIFRKRIHIKATTLRNRSDTYKADLTKAFQRDMLPAIASGTIEPVIDRVYSWTEAETAHAYMAKNQNTGKIVLTVT